jgi:hypothetical protein
MAGTVKEIRECISNRLKEYKASHRLTDEGIMDAINEAGQEHGYSISLSGLRSIMNGKSGAQIETLYCMMIGLEGFSVDYILTGHKPAVTADDAAEAIAFFKKVQDMSDNVPDSHINKAEEVYSKFAIELKQITDKFVSHMERISSKKNTAK